MLLVTVAAFFLVCLPPEAVSQQCRSGVTDEIRQSVREQLRQEQNGTISTVAVNCGQVCLVIMCGCMDVVADHATLQTTVYMCLSNECPALASTCTAKCAWTCFTAKYLIVVMHHIMDNIILVGNASQFQCRWYVSSRKYDLICSAVENCCGIVI